jgi:hypothetical protein
MQIVLLIVLVFIVSAIGLFFIDYKLNGNKNKKLYNNLKKMNDADTNRL